MASTVVTHRIGGSIVGVEGGVDNIDGCAGRW